MVEPVSVVIGPPGTGKSEVVAGMLLNQLLRVRPTLFASKNHQALEAVLPRLNNTVEGGDLIIQTSSRDLAQRQNYLTKLRTLLTRPPRMLHWVKPSSSGLVKRSPASGRRSMLSKHLNKLARNMAG